MPAASRPAQASRGSARRSLLALPLAIVILAALWRAIVAATIPCIARDSVTFCEYARELGAEGVRYLQRPTTHQHPLFPLTVLAAQRCARFLGAPDDPMTWQRSGQAVSWLAGIVVVALAGALAARFVRRLQLPIDAKLAGCGGMLLAALLPLNVWLSAEVMSDQMHLAFYLAGVLALLRLDSVKAAVVCGLAGGLAFLTRPEGIVVVLAGLVTIAAARHVGWRTRAFHGLTLIVFFAACALPYWAITGTLSAKKNPLDWLRDQEATAVAPEGVLATRLDAGQVPAAASALTARTRCAGPTGWQAALLGKLELLQLPWYALIPWALYTLFRAGRVVVPLVALFPLINLRARLLRPPLVGVTACMAAHFMLMLILLHRHHYLAPRHCLVVIMLLTPFGATLLARLVALVRAGRCGLTPVAIVFAIVLLPLAAYSLRQPNASDRYLVDVAHWLAQRDPDISSKVIMSGSSPRRIAFYAGARWAPWFEAPQYANGLCQRILRKRPDYFVVGTGAGFEQTGNEAVVAKLRGDPQLTAFTKHVEVRSLAEQDTLYVFVFDWAGGPPAAPDEAP